MLKRWVRVISDKDSVKTDVSLDLQNGNGLTHDFAATGESLYIGQMLPFNSMYIDMSVVNTTSGGELSVEYWSGNGWASCVDVLDNTELSSCPLGRDGVLQYEPNKNSSWTVISDTSEESSAGLDDFTLYNLYWMRIRSSAALLSTTKINKITYAFCTSAQLLEKDPEINTYLTAWSSGKADWQEQIEGASEMIVEELKSRNYLQHVGQILRIDDVNLACVWRTLLLIYNNLGPQFAEKRADIWREYQTCMNKRFSFDKNRDGQLQRSEFTTTVLEGLR